MDYLGEVFLTALVMFFSAGLLLYWVARALSIFYKSKERVDEVLDNDFRWGREVWLAMRVLCTPHSEFLCL